MALPGEPSSEAAAYDPTEWNEAMDEAAAMCEFVGRDDAGAADGKQDYDYVDGWEAACAKCVEYIRDLKVTEKDKEQHP